MMRSYRWTTAATLAAVLGFSTAGLHAQETGKTIVAGINSAIPLTDPHFHVAQRDANFFPHVFETLYAVGEDMAPRPQLAVSHSVSDDARTFTFKLRDGVRFHDGSIMTARDVLASWERFKRLSPRAANIGNVSTMSAPDDLTFVVNLNDPQPNFIGQTTGTGGPIAIMPASDGAKERGEVSMIGTGPFRFVENIPDERTVIARFSDYWVDDAAALETDGYAGARRALVDRVVFRAIPETGTRIAALQANELDISDNLAVPPSDRLVSQDGFVSQDVMPFSKAAIATHAGNAPTDNLLIRQAIQTAIDVPEVLEIALEGFYELESSFIFAVDPHYVPGNADEFYNRADPEAAKALLAQAGYKGEPITMLTNPNYPFMQNIALVVAEQLKAIGMTVQIETVDWATNLAQLNNKDAKWNLTPLGLSVPGDIASLANWRNVVKQYSHLSGDPVYDELSNAMLAEGDLEKRRALWGRFERHISEQAYIIQLGNRGMKVVSNDKLSGYKPFYSMRFWNVDIAE